MAHPLEIQYGLTAHELLDALDRRFRAKVTLDGVVAEVHLGKHIAAAQRAGLIARFEAHDQDGYPDYSIWLPDRDAPLRVECKNVRDSEEAYRSDGKIVAFKVEAQKTRASKGDVSSRFYGVDQFEILAVCLGKKTGNWREFVFARTADLTRHPAFPGKLAVFQRVPMSAEAAAEPWYNGLDSLIRSRFE
jgi:hypothetical protein